MRMNAIRIEPVQRLHLSYQRFDPADELGIAYKDSAMAFDWKMQYK
jgi:hypothetical protein